ncbi:MAG: SRPBCC domain-containing protein [Pseudomonadota bacterium]
MSAKPLEDKVLTIDIAAPLQKVWDEITKTGRIQKALYNTVLESTMQPGSKLRYYSPNKKRVFVVGEVLEVMPPHRFKHTYVMLIKPDQPTTVLWELTETASGCRVTLTHSGWTEDAISYEDTAKGWTQILGLLKAEMENGDIPLGMRVVYFIQGLFLFAMPKSTRLDEVERAGY